MELENTNISMLTPIHTPNFTLKPVDLDDLPYLHQLRTNTDVCRYFERDTTKTVEETKAFIETRMQNQNYFYTIYSNELKVLIGTITLWNINMETNYAEVGYELFPEFQNKGVMYEVLNALINYAFTALTFTHIEAYTHKNNVASRKLLEKCGFTLVPGKIDPDVAHNVIYSLRK